MELRWWLEFVCQEEPIFSYILGISLCLGGIISYLPQYYSLIKSKHHEGISEFSLLLLNISAVCLTANSFILNWSKFGCYYYCNFWICSSTLLSVLQIFIGWIMVFPLYLIFMRYKIKNSDKKIIYDVIYIFIYVVFILSMIIVGLAEKGLSSDSSKFFIITAKILGILAAISSSIVWIPQIISLIKTKKQGNLSLLMFIMQSPGNIFIVIFQILYHQDWTTWLTYVITFVEQMVIVIILLVLMYRNRNNTELDNL